MTCRRVPPPLGPVAVAGARSAGAATAPAPAVLTRLAVFADPWPGSVAIWRSVDGGSFQRRGGGCRADASSARRSTICRAGPMRALGSRQCRARAALWRRAGVASPIARVLGGRQCRGGADCAMARGRSCSSPMPSWSTASTYRLSRLLRGQVGSEVAMADALPAGAPFVVLGPHLVPIARGLDRSRAAAAQLRIVAAAAAATTTPRPCADGDAGRPR